MRVGPCTISLLSSTPVFNTFMSSCRSTNRLHAVLLLLLVVSVLGAGGGVRQSGERDGGHEEEAQDHRTQDAHPTDHGTSSEDSVYCINRLVCVLFKGM